ncbi:MAG: DUF4912 domain-containing protein [Opitutaceae bacterium]
MQAHGEHSASTPPTRSAAVATERARKAGSAQLNVIPVDAMRLFVHWFVPAEQLRRALTQVKGERAGARLRLRILDVRGGEHPDLDDEPRQDFAAGGGWHEGFITLNRPGGSIVVALGIQDGLGVFSALLTSLIVTLPDPAVAPAPAAPAHAREQVVPQLKPARGGHGIPAVRSRRGGNEPSMGRILARFTEPEKTSPTASPQSVRPAAEAKPETTAAASEPVIETMRQKTPSASASTGPPSTAVPPAAESAVTPTAADLPTPYATVAEIDGAPTPTAADDRAGSSEAIAASSPEFEKTDPESVSTEGERGPSSAAPEAPERFASFFGPSSAGASAFLHARLVVGGRLAPGYRLRIGGEEIATNPGGGFSYQKQLEGAPLAWAFLQQAAAMDEDASVPSLEVIAAEAEAEAPLAMSVSIEIEGQLESASHRFLLPPGIETDASGRFSFIRPLPAGAWFLPQLVLTTAQ